MKIWIPMLILAIAVASLCVWDTINTRKVFSEMETKSTYIYNSLLSTDITDNNLEKEIFNLNDF